MEPSEQLRIVEALVVGSAEPIAAARIADIVPGLDTAGVRRCVEVLNASYEEQRRAFEIWEVAGGYQLRTRPVYAGYLQQLVRDRPLRLSRAALETLAVVAYKQPATRAEIEHVRGVDVGAVLRSLVDRRLVRIAGHREVPGRPILYGTSRRFLEVFGLASLKDLPTLRELEDLVPPSEEEQPAVAAPVAEQPAEPAPSEEVAAAQEDVPEVLH